jgi:group I intron endonuclease
MYKHLQEKIEKTDNIHKCRKIIKIMEEIKDCPIILKLIDCLDEVDAYKIEMEYINEIGRVCDSSGPLTNISAGGENPPKFYDLPLDKQEEIRKIFRSKKYSQETIEKRRKNTLGKKRTEEFKKKLSESRKGDGNPMYGKKCSQEHKSKTSKSLINKKGITVVQMDLYGNTIKEYPSAHEVERQLGYKFGVIARVCRGERKTAYNFIWKYKI